MPKTRKRSHKTDLESILINKLPSFKRGDVRVGFSRDLYRVLYSHYSDNANTIPAKDIALIGDYMRTTDYSNCRSAYFKFLAVSILSLKRNLSLYGRHFVEQLFMRLEEDNISGIFRIDPAKYVKLHKALAAHGLPNEVSNTAIVMLIGKMDHVPVKQTAGKTLRAATTDNRKIRIIA